MWGWEIPCKWVFHCHGEGPSRFAGYLLLRLVNPVRDILVLLGISYRLVCATKSHRSRVGGIPIPLKNDGVRQLG